MNLRPSGYEPDELPGCSTPRQHAVTKGHPSDATRAGNGKAPNADAPGLDLRMVATTIVTPMRRLQCLATTYSSNA